MNYIYMIEGDAYYCSIMQDSPSTLYSEHQSRLVPPYDHLSIEHYRQYNTVPQGSCLHQGGDVWDNGSRHRTGES